MTAVMSLSFEVLGSGALRCRRRRQITSGHGTDSGAVRLAPGTTGGIGPWYDADLGAYGDTVVA